MSYQKCTLIGRLGSDPDLRHAPSGQPVANFSLAANRKYTNSGGEEVRETCWFKVSAWGKLAEAVKTCLKKGGQVYVEGRLICDPATGGPRLWKARDGSPAASFDVHADVIRFLGDRETEVCGAVEPAETQLPGSEIPF